MHIKSPLLNREEPLHLDSGDSLSGQLKDIGPSCFNKGLLTHIRVPLTSWDCSPQGCKLNVS